jgi:ABC-type transporter Mla maintaining outer membrane lipid asymmetry ATPase subunit MlaF
MDRIVFENVSFAYEGQETILEAVNTVIEPNSSVVILGNSGGGKSTFLKLAAGLIVPSAGSVLLEGRRTQQASKEQLIAFHKRSAVIFQDSGLLSNMTLYDNLALPLRYHTDSSEEEIRARIDRILDEMTLAQDKAHFPSELSRGERKLAGISRGMIIAPEYLFYDEPLQGLDYTAADRVKKVIIRQSQEKRTIVIVEQSLSFAMKIADKVLVFVDGRLVFDDCPDCLNASPHPFIQRLVAGRRESTSFYTALNTMEDRNTPGDGQTGE